MDGMIEESVEKCRSSLTDKIDQAKIVSSLVQNPLELNGTDVYNLAKEKTIFGQKVQTAIR